MSQQKEKKGKLIGPFPIEDWITLKRLRRSLEYMNEDPVRKANYSEAIKKEGKAYRAILNWYIKKAA